MQKNKVPCRLPAKGLSKKWKFRIQRIIENGRI
jgi:hypothetical protein